MFCMWCEICPFRQQPRKMIQAYCQSFGLSSYGSMKKKAGDENIVEKCCTRSIQKYTIYII